MYSNYSEDFKALGYEALIDTTCGKSLDYLIKKGRNVLTN